MGHHSASAKFGELAWPRKWILGVFPAAMMLLLAACGGNDNLTLENQPAPASSSASIAFSPTPVSTINLIGTAPITAVVSNDPTDAGVDWALLCQNPGNCGTLSPLHTASGKPTTYSPPSSITGNSQKVTIEAFAAANHNSNVLTPLTVTGFAGNLKGTYVFETTGIDGNGEGPYYLAGVIVLDGNGNVTSGEQTYCDTNFNASGGLILVSVTDKITGGSYYIGPDGRGTLTLNTADQNIGQLGIENFALAVASSSQAFLQTFDNETNPNLPPSNETSLGRLDLQTSAAPPSGGYAFVLNGFDISDSSLATGGIFNIDSPETISGAGSVVDQDDASTATLSESLSGTLTNPDSFGSVTFNLTELSQSPTTSTPLQFTGYIVDGTHIKLIETDNNGAVAGTGIGAGIAIGQGTATGMFTTNNAFAGNYAFDIAGEDPYEVPVTLAFDGQFTADSNGNLSAGYVDEVMSFFFSQISDSFTGTYALDASGSGRVDTNSSMTFTTYGQGPELVFYLTGNGNPPLILDADDNSNSLAFGAEGTGFAHPQSAVPYSFNGIYAWEFEQSNGTIPPNTYTGQLTASENTGGFSAVVDTNSTFTPTPGLPQVPVTGTYFAAAATGRFAGTLSDSSFVTSFPTPTVAVDFYPIDSANILFIETDLLTSGLSTAGYITTRTPVCSGCP
jgi:hypothetical protein